MVSQTAEYALRALIWLANRSEEQYTTAEIAKETKVPAGYLAKVLQSLARTGFVRSQRGLGGGFVLARPPHDITLWEIIEAVDPIKRIKT